jgi:hypothetical protein
MRVAFQGGLEDHRVAGGQGLADLVDGHLERVVPRHDRTDHPYSLLGDLAPTPGAEGGAFREVTLPDEFVDEVGGPGQAFGQRGVELRSVRQEDRRADLGHQLRPEQLALLFECRLQLQQATLP